jgi:hypothetical protein
MPMKFNTDQRGGGVGYNFWAQGVRRSGRNIVIRLTTIEDARGVIDSIREIANRIDVENVLTSVTLRPETWVRGRNYNTKAEWGDKG